MPKQAPLFDAHDAVTLAPAALDLVDEIRADVAPDGDGGKRVTRAELARLIAKVGRLLASLTGALLS